MAAASSSSSSSSENIKVAIRVRPFNQRERDQQQQDGSNNPSLLQPVIKCIPSQNRVVACGTNEKVFSVDHALWSLDTHPDGDGNSNRCISQADCFEIVGRPVLSHGANGFHSTVFTYGMTGTGKSFTLLGGAPNVVEDRGIIPRLCQELFTLEETKNSKWSFKIGFIEVYNEKVSDLLALPEKNNNNNNNSSKKPTGKKSNNNTQHHLRVREHPTKGVYLENQRIVSVSSFEDILDLIELGNKNRSVAATKMNDRSSRSHAIFQVFMEETRSMLGPNSSSSSTNMNNSDVNSENDDAAENNQQQQQMIKTLGKTSRINLVDLAGSERVSQSGVSGKQFEQMKFINLSLTTLGRVIDVLAENSTTSSTTTAIPPYRDSTLTYLLRDSLGGNSKTVMVATVSPSHINLAESLNTLEYAARARQIVNVATVNEDPKAKRIRELEEQLSLVMSKLEKIGLLGNNNNLNHHHHQNGSIINSTQQQQQQNDGSSKSANDNNGNEDSAQQKQQEQEKIDNNTDDDEQQLPSEEIDVMAEVTAVSNEAAATISELHKRIEELVDKNQQLANRVTIKKEPTQQTHHHHHHQDNTKNLSVVKIKQESDRGMSMMNWSDNDDDDDDCQIIMSQATNVPFHQHHQATRRTREDDDDLKDEEKLQREEKEKEIKKKPAPKKPRAKSTRSRKKSVVLHNINDNDDENDDDENIPFLTQMTQMEVRNSDNNNNANKISPIVSQEYLAPIILAQNSTSAERKPKPKGKRGGRKKIVSDENDDEDAAATTTTSTSKRAPSKRGRKPKNSNAVIILDDDDEDDQEESIPPLSQPPTNQNANNNSSSSQHLHQNDSESEAAPHDRHQPRKFVFDRDNNVIILRHERNVFRLKSEILEKQLVHEKEEREKVTNKNRELEDQVKILQLRLEEAEKRQRSLRQPSIPLAPTTAGMFSSSFGLSQSQSQSQSNMFSSSSNDNNYNNNNNNRTISLSPPPVPLAPTAASSSSGTQQIHQRSNSKQSLLLSSSKNNNYNDNSNTTGNNSNNGNNSLLLASIMQKYSPNATVIRSLSRSPVPTSTSLRNNNNNNNNTSNQDAAQQNVSFTSSLSASFPQTIQANNYNNSLMMNNNNNNSANATENIIMNSSEKMNSSAVNKVVVANENENDFSSSMKPRRSLRNSYTPNNNQNFWG